MCPLVCAVANSLDWQGQASAARTFRMLGKASFEAATQVDFSLGSPFCPPYGRVWPGSGPFREILMFARLEVIGDLASGQGSDHGSAIRGLSSLLVCGQFPSSPWMCPGSLLQGWCGHAQTQRRNIPRLGATQWAGGKRPAPGARSAIGKGIGRPCPSRRGRSRTAIRRGKPCLPVAMRSVAGREVERLLPRPL